MINIKVEFGLSGWVVWAVDRWTLLSPPSCPRKTNLPINPEFIELPSFLKINPNLTLSGIVRSPEVELYTIEVFKHISLRRFAE